MSATADPNQSFASPPDQQRRDFLLIATATVGAVGTALAMAALTGMLFGLLPAYRASRLDPVAALRYE